VRVLEITTAYDFYWDDFYTNHPSASEKTYDEQMRDINLDFLVWGNGWCDGIGHSGWEAKRIIINAAPLQAAWVKEHGMETENLSYIDVVIAQIKEYKPDVAFFLVADAILLERIKSECPFIKFYFSWIGSAIFKWDILKQMDLVFSCAPESVSILRNSGIKAEHLNHAFNIQINDYLDIHKKQRNVFVGQMVRANNFHLFREKMLLAIKDEVELVIYSPSANLLTIHDFSRTFFKRLLYCAIKTSKDKLHVPSSIVKRIPYADIVSQWENKPLYPVNMKLKSCLKKPVWGIKMYQTLADALVVLNIHADSSPEYASNMRLFETTGVGSCLLTDWKKNIHELFEPDYEIVTYKSSAECVEKIKWLNEHPDKAQEIAMAGQKKCLENYTNMQQGEKIRQYIDQYMAR